MEPRRGEMVGHDQDVGCGGREQPGPPRLRREGHHGYGEVDQAHRRLVCQLVDVDAATPGRIANDDQIDVAVGEAPHQLEGVPADAVVAVLHDAPVDGDTHPAAVTIRPGAYPGFRGAVRRHSVTSRSSSVAAAGAVSPGRSPRPTLQARCPAMSRTA